MKTHTTHYACMNYLRTICDPKCQNGSSLSFTSSEHPTSQLLITPSLSFILDSQTSQPHRVPSPTTPIHWC